MSSTKTLILAGIALALGLASCAPAAAPPTAAPAKPAPTAAPAKPAPSPAAKPEAKPSAEWEQLVAAAKQEGKVVMIGPAGDAPRLALADAFQQKLGISVDFWPAPGRDIPPRLSAEREAGQFLWDIYVGGPLTPLTALIPMGAFDPIEPALFLPEVRDRQKWRDGDLEFLDEGRLVVGMTPRQRAIIFVNTNLAKPEEFKSYRDLLDPKWKGKIVMDDPRRGGPGQSTFIFFYLHPELGEGFIRALAQQEPTLLQDFRQEADAVGQGRFPIMMGGDEQIVLPLMESGAPIAVADPRQLREGSDRSVGVGNLALFNRAPHPNAAKVYVNWLLSQEGQTIFAQHLGYISNRLDVPLDPRYPWREPIPGAIKSYDARAIASLDQLGPLMAELFGR